MDRANIITHSVLTHLGGDCRWNHSRRVLFGQSTPVFQQVAQLLQKLKQFLKMFAMTTPTIAAIYLFSCRSLVDTINISIRDSHKPPLSRRLLKVRKTLTTRICWQTRVHRASRNRPAESSTAKKRTSPRQWESTATRKPRLTSFWWDIFSKYWLSHKSDVK